MTSLFNLMYSILSEITSDKLKFDCFVSDVVNFKKYSHVFCQTNGIFSAASKFSFGCQNLHNQ